MPSRRGQAARLSSFVQSLRGESTATGWRLTPLSAALSVALAAGGLGIPAISHAAGAWFAAPNSIRNASTAPGMLPNGLPASALPGTAQQTAASRAQLQQSIANLNHVAAAIAAQQATQAAARAAAQNTVSTVTDGLGVGGLETDFGAGWSNADHPVQSASGGQTTVTIKQTADKAILNWKTFSVGRNTTLDFEQQPDWAVLNKITAADRPSQIEGRIKADGTVLIVNPNGIVFSGTSQIDTRSLVAAAATMSDDQFLNHGLYSAQISGGYVPSFTDAAKDVMVEAGAQLATAAPGSVTQGGGYVLLLGRQVSNDGTISTEQGQALLAAGGDFVIRAGQGTQANSYSTTRGNEVVGLIDASSPAGAGVVQNTGLIQSPQGDITLTGRTVTQNGVAVSSTTVNQRGTIHLSTSATDSQGSVTLGPNATTAVLLDDSGGTALDSQRDALITQSAQQDLARRAAAADAFTNLSREDDREDLSRIEIVSGSGVQYAAGSVTLATGGQIVSDAQGRSLVAGGSVLDVSGAVGVQVAMASNNLEINIQGNEQRDAPGARDAANLNNSNVWVDARTLVYVAPGVGGYSTARDYTAGGLLEVSGYVGLSPHGIGEWLAQGGTVSFAGGEVVTRKDASINLSGGTLDVQSGYLRESWMRGSDGRLYEVSSAPGDLTYTGLYQGYEDVHARWGDATTRYYMSPVLGPNQSFEPGYTVGRDAGKLIVSTASAVLEGGIVSATYQGGRQENAPADGVDGYGQSQFATARGAQLILGKEQSVYAQGTGAGLVTGVFYTLSPAQQAIVFGAPDRIADALAVDTPLPDDRQGKAYVDSALLNGDGLGGIIAVAGGSVTVDNPLTVNPGGTITLYAPQVNVNANLTAHAGSIALGDVLSQVATSGKTVDALLPAPTGILPGVMVGAGVLLDAAGLWSNLLADPADRNLVPYVNGGDASIRSSGAVTLSQGSVIDVSSGATLLQDGSLQGGTGGDVTLAASYTLANATSQPDSPLTLGGTLRGYGVKGGGALTIQSGTAIDIGGPASGQPQDDTALVLDPSLFQSGFSAYAVAGDAGAAVGDNVRLDVTMPVLYLQDRVAARAVPTGSDPRAALSLWLPPLYQEDPVNAVLAQRGGASFSLSAGALLSFASAPLMIGQGAVVNVDPGQSINLHSDGQMTLDGRLNAWGGSINLNAMPENADALRYTPGLSVWIGGDAVLDAAARPYVAYDQQGRAYGVAPDGGSITVSQSDGYVIVRPGALLDVSGAAAQVDASAGGPANAAAQPLLLAGGGGGIELHSNSGIVLDGTLRAAAGGGTALGGSLALYQEYRSYLTTRDVVDPVAMNQLYTITLVQDAGPSGLAADLQLGQADPDLVFGQTLLGANQLQAGGFASLTASAQVVQFRGDLDLSLAGSATLRGGLLTVADDTPDAQVRIAAPYIKLDGDGSAWSRLSGGSTGGFVAGLFTPAGGYESSGRSALTLSAGLIDITGKVASGAFGLRGGLTDESSTGYVGLPGFAGITLSSRGDVRLDNGSLAGPGDIEVDAAQIYPMSGANGAIEAGLRVLTKVDAITHKISVTGLRIDPDSTLAIRSSTGTVPDAPDSVFGNLVLLGGTVDQGGVVRAPLGTISIDTTGGSLGTDWQNEAFFVSSGVGLVSPVVILRGGSLTSVSAAGLVMPYGGTVDGVTYDGVQSGVGKETATEYNLADTLVVRGDNSGTKTADSNVLATGISIGAARLTGELGAVLDLSGGGTLAGEGFVSGRGGSVNVLATPLYNANPAANAYSSASNQVYAIVPGYASQYAPVLRANDLGAGEPAIGRQISLGAGVPGLPAGTYTLLPASFALMPGAYRVELGSAVSPRTTGRAVAMSNGSYATTAVQGTAGTGQRDSLATQVILTPGQSVRKYSQYNETTFSQFLLAQAGQFGQVRPRLPEDGKLLNLTFVQDGAVADPLDFAGTVRFGGGADADVSGIGGAMFVTAGSAMIEVRPDGAVPTAGMVSLADADLDAFAAPSLTVGGIWRYTQGLTSNENGARIYFDSTGRPGVTVRAGAAIKAGQVFLAGNAVDVEGGATLDTRGFGGSVIDSTLGYVYDNSINETVASYPGPAVLAVANGWLDFLPSAGNSTITVGDGASLLTGGTISFAAPGGLALGNANLGAKYLTVSQDQIDVGTAASLAAAASAGALQPGWQLTQDVLDRLLHPSATAGVPALERLTLTAGGAFNFYGSVSLDTGDSPVRMVFNTPAFYGWGTDGDVVRIATNDFLWNGIATGAGTPAKPYVSGSPAAVQPGGPGTGTGQLVIAAHTVEFGYDDLSRPQSGTALDRLALGFAGVTIRAADRVTANHLGTLTVGGTQAADGSRGGGDLSIVTPLLTGEGGSAMTYTAGGAIVVTTPAGVAPAGTSAIGDLGGSVTLKGQAVSLDTAVALPSGVLTVQADGDILLKDGAQIDLSGRGTTFYDVTEYSWGGNVSLASDHGGITQAAGSKIDVSAGHNDAGSLTASAAQGSVLLGGTLLGQGGQGDDDGRLALTVGTMDAAGFAALNDRLNQGGFYGARGFDLKTGDLTVGVGVKARQVSITTDAGSLVVDGAIDASGDTPGSITLSAGRDLTLAGNAVLDTHGKVLQVDSLGAPIDASNRGRIVLTATNGTVRLVAGSTMDLSAPDGIARGEVDINAPRTSEAGGDIRIDAAGPLTIRGAASVAVNGFWNYSPTDPDGTVTQDNGDADGNPVGANGVAGLKQIDARSAQFIDAAWNNGDLQRRLAGLNAYGGAFHLRPGVEISSTGDLNTQGDLDLSGYRYGPHVDASVRGSGEPGVLILRAGGNLKINGSINDGFAPPANSPDGDVYGTIYSNTTLTREYDAIGGEVLASGTKLPTAANLGFDLQIARNTFLYPTSGHPLPFDVVTSASITVGKSAVTNPDQTLLSDVILPTGVVYARGTRLSSLPSSLPAGTLIKAGSGELTVKTLGIRAMAMTVPKGTTIALLVRPGGLATYTLADAITLEAGDTLPAGTQVTSLAGLDPDESRSIWAIAPMLAAGTQSWSLRLVAGADLGSADTRAVHSRAQGGDLVLDNPFQVNTSPNGLGSAGPGVSVVRTGTGGLDMYAAGDYMQLSPYGVYTAGTAVADTGEGTIWNAPREVQADGTLLGSAVPARERYEDTIGQRMWYPTAGGDFTLSVGGDIVGYEELNSEMVGAWLLRQGGADLGQATGWGVNFGTYVLDGSSQLGGSYAALGLATYSGLGALGGGNVVVRAGGNIGVDNGTRQNSIVVAVGGSGRVIGGSVVQTGGGRLSVTAGGRVIGGQYDDLRGDTTLRAAGVGAVNLQEYGVNLGQDPRGVDAGIAYAASSRGGASFAPGDGAVTVQTLGDLVMGNVIDPGRAEERLETSASASASGRSGSAATWFTLWTNDTAIDLVSAGGNASPLGSQPGSSYQSVTTFLPSVLHVAAPNGSIYYAARANYDYLMPSPTGQLELLAGDRVSAVSANSYQNISADFGLLGVSAGAIATPQAPAWRLRAAGALDQAILASNYWSGSYVSTSDSTTNLNVYMGNYTSGQSYSGLGGTPFMFDPETLTDDSMEGAGVATRIYAVAGDVQDVQIGATKSVRDPATGTVIGTYYWASKPVKILAGGDIVNSSGLFAHGSANDVSMVAAGGDMFFSNTNDKGFSIVGPGTLEISASGDIYMGNTASFVSLGAVAQGDARPGADIVVQAGLGAGAPGVGQTDYAGFAERYLDPANQADASLPLAGQPGKVAHAYGAELRKWLESRFGYQGAQGADELAYFLALPPEQQRIFARQIYYAELLAGGREYNDPDSKRYQSYLRGRDAIAALFPTTDAQGSAVARSGDLTMFQGAKTNAGIWTVKGGSIQTLTPGGQTIVGVEGVTPAQGSTVTPAGLLTQGAGDIQMYSQGSVLLGLSRIMTTFGGNIQVWSAQGDINAGRGSKTTIVYTPPSVLYDAMGNITLSPQVPSTGAGIATLNPIPEVPPGDVDLIAPEGTIDAGEAGIRVSGNVNLAALQVVNAANIQVQGKATGIPVVVAVNTGALTSASAAASNAVVAAQDAVARSREAARQALPSIFTVQILGFGSDGGAGGPAPVPAPAGASARPVRYNPDGVVQVEGAGG